MQSNSTIITPIVDIIAPINHKGREYWPPVFFSPSNDPTNAPPQLGSFGKCFLNLFGVHEDRTYVDVEFGLRTGLVIKHTKTPGPTSVALEHSRFCPMRNLEQTPELAARAFVPPLPPVKVGVAVVIENQFRKVLITRRSATMRTFPNVWVVPGGHMNIGETLAETAAREVFEETGLKINKEQVSILAIYESVFPVQVASGLPSDHHTVVYMKAIVDIPETSLCLQVFEVNAAAWISKDTVISALVTDNSPVAIQTFEAFELANTLTTTPTLDITSSLLKQTMFNITCLQSIMLSDGSVPSERLSTGCRFALREWLRTV